MEQRNWLAEGFERHRAHLRAVAYQMLGSVSEADDALQESWLRLTRADTSQVENLDAWLTTIVARVSLNMLRARRSRGEELIGLHMAEPIVTREDGPDPEREALLADSVSLAMLVVLETLAPAERLAFVLHDLFAVPFDEIAPIVGRSPTAARKLASRGRRRLQAATPVSDTDLAHQRELVSVFLAAARDGDFDRLLEVLDPDVVLRTDAGTLARGGLKVVKGAQAVARRAHAFSRTDRMFVPALVNGASGLVSFEHGQAVSVLGFTITGRKIVEIDILADPARLAKLDLQNLCG
jgi:RNA polymerase sigma factor (sigma-70 family)